MEVVFDEALANVCRRLGHSALDLLYDLDRLRLRELTRTPRRLSSPDAHRLPWPNQEVLPAGPR